MHLPADGERAARYEQVLALSLSPGTYDDAQVPPCRRPASRPGLPVPPRREQVARRSGALDRATADVTLLTGREGLPERHATIETDVA